MSAARSRRRERIFQREMERHGGVVPCFVCGRPVHPKAATLEHIVPRSRGGSNANENLAISHGRCNHGRGSPPIAAADGQLKRKRAPKKPSFQPAAMSAPMWPAQRGINENSEPDA